MPSDASICLLTISPTYFIGRYDFDEPTHQIAPVRFHKKAGQTVCCRNYQARRCERKSVVLHDHIPTTISEASQIFQGSFVAGTATCFTTTLPLTSVHYTTFFDRPIIHAPCLPKSSWLFQCAAPEASRAPCGGFPPYGSPHFPRADCWP